MKTLFWPCLTTISYVLLVCGSFLLHGSIGDTEPNQSGNETNLWVLADTSAVVPPTRAFHAACGLVNFPCGSVQILFGGLQLVNKSISFTFLNDFWILDVSAMQWYEPSPASSQTSPTLVTDLETSSPSARAGPTIIALNSIQLVLFGGWNATAVMSDVWSFDVLSNPLCTTRTSVGTWTHERSIVCMSGGACPAARFGHAAVSLLDSMVIFGGASEPWTTGLVTSLSLSDTSVWRLWKRRIGRAANLTWEKVTVTVAGGGAGPGQRYSAIASSLTNASMLLASGCDSDLELSLSLFISL